MGEIPSYNPEEESKVETIETKGNDREERVYSLMDRFRLMHRSIYGKGLMFLFLVSGGIKFGLDYRNGHIKNREAWDAYLSSHPKITRISQENYGGLSAERQKQIMAIRDVMYSERLKDALKVQAAKNGQPLPENVIQGVESFQPSVYDEQLIEMGLGKMVKTDKPLPLLEFKDPDEMFKNLGAPSGDLVGKYVNPNEGDFFGPQAKEDILYIDPSKTHPAAEIHQIILHEYLHSIQYKNGPEQEEPLLKPIDRNEKLDLVLIDEQQFSEGATDLIRLELCARLKEPAVGMSYPGQSFAVFEIMNSLGQENFWSLYSEGNFRAIVTGFDKIYGEGTANKLLDSFSGGVALANPSYTISSEAIDTFKSLQSKNLLQDKDFEDFTTKYGLYFPPVSEKFIYGRDGQVEGFINVYGRNNIEMSAVEGEKTIVIDNQKPSDGISIQKIPELQNAWANYLSGETPKDRHVALAQLKAELAKYIAKNRR